MDDNLPLRADKRGTKQGIVTNIRPNIDKYVTRPEYLADEVRNFRLPNSKMKHIRLYQVRRIATHNCTKVRFSNIVLLEKTKQFIISAVRHVIKLR